jgi:hypothetical protein
MSDDDKSKIIPFGKYKGRMIEEVLVDDPQYLQWLTGQDWFRQKYVVLHQVIINRGAEPEETPEHNALQVLFLDDAFCISFIDVVVPGWRDEKTLAEIGREALAKHLASIRQTIVRQDKKLLDANESLSRARKRTDDGHWVESATDDVNRANDELARWRGKEKSLPTTLTFHIGLTRKFEWRGVDVRLGFGIQSHETVPTEYWDGIRWGPHAQESEPVIARRQELVSVEIKPVVGDDYPAVLRQIGALRHGSEEDRFILFLERYTGIGATEEQFIRTFATAGIRVVFRRDIALAPTLS